MGIAERKNRQKQALRERILDAARRIVMREGFAALSMRKIADAIEYSPATLYLHFASRDEIAQALCAEGYAQLLQTFVPLARTADPAERLKALGRAYVAFGVAHPETYRLIFMEDPSYTGAALGGAAAAREAGAAGAPAEGEAAGDAAADATASGTLSAASMRADETGGAPIAAEDDPGGAALHLMIAALEELKAAGRLSASVDVAVWAEALWATLHGIVALNLTCPVFPTASLDTVVGVALDVWLSPQHAAQPQSATSVEGAVQTRKRKSPQARVEALDESGGKSGNELDHKRGDEQGSEPGSEPGNTPPTQPSIKKSAKTPAKTDPEPDTKPAAKPAARSKASSA